MTVQALQLKAKDFKARGYACRRSTYAPRPLCHPNPNPDALNLRDPFPACH